MIRAIKTLVLVDIITAILAAFLFLPTIWLGLIAATLGAAGLAWFAWHALTEVQVSDRRAERCG